MTGVAVLAALLALQSQPSPSDSTADSLKVRDYVSVGAAAMTGYYLVIVRIPKTRISTRRERDYHTAGATAAWRHETPTWSVGVRGQLFSGSDQANQRSLANGFRAPSPDDSAFTTALHGGAGMVDVDWTYVGLSAGFVAGDLVTRKTDQPSTFPSPIAGGALRLGALSRFYGEVEIHDHVPAP